MAEDDFAQWNAQVMSGGPPLESGGNPTQGGNAANPTPANGVNGEQGGVEEGRKSGMAG